MIKNESVVEIYKKYAYLSDQISYTKAISITSTGENRMWKSSNLRAGQTMRDPKKLRAKNVEKVPQWRTTLT